MDQSEDLAAPKYWLSKLGPFPKQARSGPGLALTPAKAAAILSYIARGIQGKAAFAIVQISPQTYDRYCSKADYIRERRAYMVESDIQRELDEDEELAYLVSFSDLAEKARETAALQYALARTSVLQGGLAKTTISKTKTRTRQAVVKGEIVELIDNETTCVEIARDRAPKVLQQPEDDQYS